MHILGKKQWTRNILITDLFLCGRLFELLFEPLTNFCTNDLFLYLWPNFVPNFVPLTCFSVAGCLSCCLAIRSRAASLNLLNAESVFWWILSCMFLRSCSCLLFMSCMSSRACFNSSWYLAIVSSFCWILAWNHRSIKGKTDSICISFIWF